MIRFLQIPAFGYFLFLTIPLCADEVGWESLPSILGRISPPSFLQKNYVITNYGGDTNGMKDSSDAISRAISQCASSGGGHVIVPQGEFLTGPIHLESNIDLHLEKGAILKFSTDPKRYLPLVPTRFEGMDCMNYSPLVYAKDKTNIALSGEGTLDGQADASNWLEWKKKTGTKSQLQARSRLDRMVNEDVPLEKRIFGQGSYLRPDFIEFNNCKNVLIEGVKIRRSPMWEIHPLFCTNVTVRGVEIISHGANNDGCDPESCADVLIEKCLFDTGDDCIAIKSGRNNDGRRVGIPSQNIIIRDCIMRDGHGGTTIGSEVSGGCRNVFIENCQMSSPDLTCALRIKSNAMRGGILENIFMRNIKVGVVKDSVLQIDLLYEEGPNGAHNPFICNVVMDNISVENAPRILNVRGYPGATIKNVRILNSSFGEITKPDVIENADVQLLGCHLGNGL
jgi:unsaturated rhamnogalacturonyl hydrolase